MKIEIDVEEVISTSVLKISQVLFIGLTDNILVELQGFKRHVYSSENSKKIFSFQPNGFSFSLSFSTSEGVLEK